MVIAAILVSHGERNLGRVPNAPRDGYPFRSLYKTKMAAIDRKIWNSDQYRYVFSFISYVDDFTWFTWLSKLVPRVLDN